MIKLRYHSKEGDEVLIIVVKGICRYVYINFCFLFLHPVCFKLIFCDLIAKESRWLFFSCIMTIYRMVQNGFGSRVTELKTLNISAYKWLAPQEDKRIQIPISLVHRILLFSKVEDHGRNKFLDVCCTKHKQQQQQNKWKECVRSVSIF